MGKNSGRIAAVLALGSLGLLLCYGCEGGRIVIGKEPTYRQETPPGHGPPPWAPAHGYRAKHRYRYYPSSGVYFDSGRGVYIYSRGGDWHVSVSLPREIRIDLDDYVTLEMDTDKPYEYHTDVVKRYPPGQAKKSYKGKDKSEWK